MSTIDSATVSLSANARWIWSSEASRAYHNIVCFRREFEIAAGGAITHDTAPTLLITADSRYEVHVNGVWLGHGPARSWPSPWPVDPYDLRAVLRPGRNVIAVLVQHFGIGTFQYLHAEPGLLAQLTWRDVRGIQTLVTDDSGEWSARPHAGHLWPVPRISCMQPWEEQFDARAFSHDWAAADPSPATAAELATWSAAVAVRKAGEGSHAKLTLRDIPQLTREPVDPVCVRAIETVHPARHSWNLNPRAYLNSHDATANVPRGNMLLLTHVHSERAQAVQFHQPHHRPFVPWTLNGKPLAFDDHSLQRTDTGVAHARLKVGWNTLMCTLPPCDHYWWTVISTWTDQPITWSAQPQPAFTSPTPWLAIGPFGNPDLPPPPPAANNIRLTPLRSPRAPRLPDSRPFAPAAACATTNSPPPMCARSPATWSPKRTCTPNAPPNVSYLALHRVSKIQLHSSTTPPSGRLCTRRPRPPGMAPRAFACSSISDVK